MTMGRIVGTFSLLILSMGSIETSAASAEGSGRKVGRLLERGAKAVQDRKYGKAESCLREARGLHPQSALLALRHAEALAALGSREAALSALEDAARLGFADPDDVRDSKSLSCLLDDPRAVASIAQVESRRKEARAELAAALAPVVPPTASGARSLEELNRSIEERSAGRQDEGWWPASSFASYVAQQKEVAIRVGALERYVADHPGAADREEAWIAEIREFTRLASTLRGWYERPSRGTVLATEGFLRAFPSSPLVEEARFWKLAATLEGTLPADFDKNSRVPPLRCAEVNGDLRSLAAGTPTSAWTRRADAYMARCLDQSGSGDLDAEKAAVKLYFGDDPPVDSLADFGLRASMIDLRFRLDGAPDFQAKSLDGRPITLASLRGKVALLEFWGPG
jgi:hypothetical protein